MWPKTEVKDSLEVVEGSRVIPIYVRCKGNTFGFSNNDGQFWS